MNLEIPGKDTIDGREQMFPMFVNKKSSNLPIYIQICFENINVSPVRWCDQDREFVVFCFNP